MNLITRSEIMRERYRWIQYFINGQEFFRELPQYGNRDARFAIGSEIGYIHWDQYNAIGQPISHLAKWVSEKTGINEDALRLCGYALVGYGAYRFFK